MGGGIWVWWIWLVNLHHLMRLVVGIDINHFLKEMEASSEKCLYPAADFEALSKFVQMKLNYPSYRTPVLIGYSSGATLIYAALVQAPPNTFLGGISMGFCPDLLLTRPMCRGSGLEWTAGPKGKGYNFLPASSLEVPWIALQGQSIRSASRNRRRILLRRCPRGEVMVLPKVGHGFSVPKNWMPQFKKAFSSIIGQGRERECTSKGHIEWKIPVTVGPSRLLKYLRPEGIPT